MSEVALPKQLPHEATVLYHVNQEIENNKSIQSFMSELSDSEKSRCQELMHHIGYMMFMNGLVRPPRQNELSVEAQAVILNKETDLFLQGAAELFDYMEG